MDTETKNKRLKFLGGFISWYLVNGLIAFLLNISYDVGGLIIWGFFVLPANVILLIIFSVVKRLRPVALGVLSSMAANFLITLILTGTIGNAICFVPLIPSRSPARVVTTPTPVNLLPEGFHDGNSGRVKQADCVAFGWAVDPDDRGEDVNVRVLSDGKVMAEKVASIYRPDLNAPNGCSGGTCGFLFELWGLISHNQQHTIQVQAQDLQTGVWKDLSSTPKTLDCGN